MFMAVFLMKTFPYWFGILGSSRPCLWNLAGSLVCSEAKVKYTFLVLGQEGVATVHRPTFATGHVGG